MTRAAPFDGADADGKLARRQMLTLAAGAAAAMALPASAAPRNMPMVGIQLFQFIEAAQRDLAGTLRMIAAIGYRHVELLAGLAPPPTMATALRDAGLTAPSVHASAFGLFPGVPNLTDDLEMVIACCRMVGAQYLVCSTPWIRGGLPGGTTLEEATGRFDLRAWQDHAAFLNATSATVRKAGLKLAYHNHRDEFRKVGGVSGFDVVLHETSPDALGIELDCGWAHEAGEDPIAILRRNRGRIALLHLKDMASRGAGSSRPPQSVPLGQGALDIAGILAEARRSDLLAAFVEQEPPFQTPPEASARISWAFLQRHGLR